MAEITKELGRIPVSRGDYQASTEYYKDNIVQYKRGSYQVVSESPIIGIPPTNDKNIVNPGWTLFAGTLDAQDVVNQIKEQEAKSVQAVADREAEILTKSDAAEVSFNTTGTSLSGTNVQDALKETDGKLSELDGKTKGLTDGIPSLTYTDVLVDKKNKVLESRDSEGKKTIHTDVEVKGIFEWNGLNKFVSKTDFEEKLSETETIEFAEVLVDSKKRILESTDKDGKKVFYGDVETKGYVKTLAEETSIIDSVDIVYAVTDAKGKIIYCVKKDGSVNIPNLVVDAQKYKPLKGKELFTIGDSLSFGGNWQSKVAEITGCTFSQEKNARPGYLLSCGGEGSSGSGKNKGFARVVNLKNAGYNPGIIIFQTVWDFMAFNDDGTPNNTTGTIEDKPYILSQIKEGYNQSDWSANLLSNIPQSERKFGTAIGLNYITSGTNLKITSLPTREGDITLSVYTAQTGMLNYGIHLMPTDTIAEILTKILEYNYGIVFDTESDDGVSVNFSTGDTRYPVTVSITDNGNTGIGTLITQIENAKATQYKYFNGETLSDWTDTTKWLDSITLYRALKGMVEFCQVNFPEAKLAFLLFPYNGADPNDYKQEDGTFDQYGYANRPIMRQMQAAYTAQIAVCELYNIPVIRADKECGITIANYSNFYPINNVHPNNDGYELVGNYISKKLISII